MSKWTERLKETKLVKGVIYAIVGVFSYPGICIINKLKITGTENIENLPKQNVLFVSNHQTYFADVEPMHESMECATGTKLSIDIKSLMCDNTERVG